MFGNYRVFDGDTLIESTDKFIDANLTLGDQARKDEGVLVFSGIEMHNLPQPEETETEF